MDISFLNLQSLTGFQEKSREDTHFSWPNDSKRTRAKDIQPGGTKHSELYLFKIGEQNMLIYQVIRGRII